MAHESGIPFICFTDDPALTSKTWTIVVVEPRVAGDATRSARFLKIIGHPSLDEYDETLWVDNTVELRQSPHELFDTWLDGVDVAAPLHSFRASILAEAEAIIDDGFDDFARVYEQMSTYLSTDPDVLEENPHWTGILARRRTAVQDAAMQTWWEHVLRYSRRDQLSFLPAMRAHGVSLRSVPLEAEASPWHAWPRAEGRDLARKGSGLRASLRPAPGRIGQLEAALDEATRSLAVTVAHREQVIADKDRLIAHRDLVIAEKEETLVRLGAGLEQTHEHVRVVEAELAKVRADRDAMKARLRVARARVRELRQLAARKSDKLHRLRRKVLRLEAQVRRPVGVWARTRRLARRTVGRSVPDPH